MSKANNKAESPGFKENEVPQSLTGDIYETKNFKRLELLFDLEKQVYDTFSDIAALRSSSRPVPIAQAAEGLRRKMIPLLIFLEPMMKKKAKTIGVDFWDGEEIHLGALDIPEVVTYCNTEIREIYGLGRVVDLPERITYATREHTTTLGSSGKAQNQYQDTVIPYDAIVTAFRETRRFMEIVQLNLFVDDKLPIMLRVPGVNDEDFK